MASATLKFQYAIFGAILLFLVWLFVQVLPEGYRWIVYTLASVSVGVIIFYLKTKK